MSHIYNKYPPSFDFKGLKVLNIGCGFGKYAAKNVVNVDAFDNCEPNLVHDLNKTPYPFESETFDIVIANHILEHLDNWWGAFNECARVLKPNGKMEIWVPSGGTDSIFGFRDHVTEINHCSFFGTFGTYRAGGNAWAIEHAVSPANKMKMIGRQTNLKNKWWIKKSPKFIRNFIREHLRNVGEEDGFFFRKVTEAEHQAEMQRFQERVNELRTVPL